MRLATLERDFWQLRSGEQAHREHPETFWIPPLAQRQSLVRGQAVKLVFEIEGQENGAIVVQGERMWVIVAEKIGAVYIGILDNKPACLEPLDKVFLCFGAEVPFLAEHVVDIAQPPQEYIDWKLGQAPERTWPRG
jgi:hypothetical protein